MEYGTVKILTFSIHILIIILFYLPLFWKFWKKSIIELIVRIYIAMFTWFLICYFCNGCPLSYLENYISLKYYNIETYPNYKYEDSAAYKLVKFDLYIPLLFIIVYKYWKPLLIPFLFTIKISLRLTNNIKRYFKKKESIES